MLYNELQLYSKLHNENYNKNKVNKIFTKLLIRIKM